MEIAVYVLIALGVLSTAAFLFLKIRFGGLAGLLSKTLTAVLFVLTALFAFMANDKCDSIYGMFIIMGLIFGLLGDIFLDLKYVYRADSDAFTFTGMGCFALGHIAYMSGIYLTFYQGDIVTLVVPIAIAVVFAVAVILGGPLLKMKYGKFKVPALIYAFLLTFMLCANATFMIKQYSPFWLVMTLGGLMFILSDLALSQIYFVYNKVTDADGKETEVLIHEKNPWFITFIHITYFAAQFLIASSILLFK